MPLFEVELDDGRIFDIEADRQPTNEEIQSALQPYQSMQNLAGATAAGAAQGLLSVPAGAIGGAGALGEIVGLEDNALQRAGEAITEFGQEQFPVSRNYESSSLPEIAGAIGQAGGQLLTIPVGGVAGKIIGGAAGAVRGAQIAGLGSGALMGADAGQETADRLGIENRAQRAALILGQAGIELGTEMLGGFGSKEFTQGILGRVAEMPWKNPSILSTALAEGGEEVLAGTARPLLERGVLMGEEAPSGAELTGIPLTSVDATLDVLKQGALGAVAGGFMGGVNSFLNRPEPKNVLNFRLRAKARINELQNAAQLTEQEQAELNELQTEDQNAAQWLQNYGEQNVYEPLRQVVNPTSEWRNQRAIDIANTEDEAGKQNLLRQTNEEIKAASEVLERAGNPFSAEATDSALNEALTPPDAVTEATIRQAAADPAIAATQAVAEETASAGAPATATVLQEQADLKAAQNVVALEQEQLNNLQQNETQTTLTEDVGQPVPSGAQEQSEPIQGAVQSNAESNNLRGAPERGEMAEGNRGERSPVSQGRGFRTTESGTISTLAIPEQASAPTQPIEAQPNALQIPVESVIREESASSQGVRQGNQELQEAPREGEAQGQEVAFEQALRNETKDLPKWTDARIAEAVEWFTGGRQGPPPWGVGPVNRAVLAVDQQARSDWNRKEQELLRRFKRADVQDQQDVDDAQAKRLIEQQRQDYFEIPSEELSLSVPFARADGMSNRDLAIEIRNTRADFEQFKQSFREQLQPFQVRYRELSATQGAQEAWRQVESENPEGASLYDRYLGKAANLSRLEAEMEQRGLNPDEPVPEGLKDYVPPKARRERNKPLKKGSAKTIQDVWTEISKADESFRGNASTATDPNTLAQEMSGGRVRGYVDAGGDVVFRSPNGQINIENPESSRPTIYALGAQSEGKAQGGGSLLYQIAFAWAHNNGKTIFPSNNLTEINAYVRRTSNMLSSALRYGSTKHMIPDQDQRISGWKKGDDKGNIARLAWRESQQVLKAIPEAANIRYDFQTGEFYQPEATARSGENAESQQPSSRRNLSPQDLEAIVSESLDGGYANELGIGETTLKRAIITNTAAQEQEINRVASAPRGILYSQQDTEDTGATLEDAQRGLQELRSTPLGSLLSNDVVIVQSLQELREVTANRPFPEKVYALLNRAEGFFRPSTGESYVILDRVNRLNGESYSDAVKRIIFHERAFHGGLKWMYQNDPSFARKAVEVVSLIPKAERDALRDYPGIGDSEISMLEEWLARKLQQEDPNELAQRDSLFRRIWQAIKDFIARVLGKPVTSEYVDREARKLVGEILRNREAFGNQAMAMDEDVVAQRDADASTRFSIPFSQREADLNIQQLKQEAGFPADAPDDMVSLHQVLGQATDQPYIVQRIRPQADFVRQRLWTGGLDAEGNPIVNEENTRNFWRQNDLQASDPNWAVNLQDDFREQAAQSTEPEVRSNRAEAIGSIAQLELMNYAQLMAASGTTDAQEAVDAIKRGRYANDITLLRYATISGSARALNARAQAARNGMLGFWNGLNMLEDKNEKEVSSRVGKGNVKKIQDEVNNPQDQDIDTRGIENPPEVEAPTAPQILGIDEEAIVDWRTELEQDGVDRMVDSFFRGGDGPQSQAGPLIEGSNWLNQTLSQLMNEQLDAMGVQRGQANNTETRERIIRELGLSDVRSGKLREFSSRLVERINEVAADNPEFARRLMDQWEQVTSFMRDNTLSGSLSRRAIHDVLRIRRERNRSLPRGQQGAVASLQEIISLQPGAQEEAKRNLVNEIIQGIRESSRMTDLQGNDTFISDEKLNQARRSVVKSLDFLLQEQRSRMAKAAQARAQRLQDELNNRPNREASDIIDRIDKQRTEWVGPEKNKSKVRALKEEAISTDLTDPSRPGHLTRIGFIQRYSQGFEALGVQPVTANTLSSRLYEENRRLKTNQFIREMDAKVRAGGVNNLAKDLLSDPRNVLGDPALMKERMIEWLKGTGLTEEQASRWAKRHEKVFREKLIQAKEKALDRAIKGIKTITTTSVERIRQAIRAGALDPSTGVRDAIAEALGAKGLTAQDLQKMAAADLVMRDGSPTEQQIALSKIRDILQSKMPDTTAGQRVLQAYIQSVLSGLSTQSLGFTVPFFTNMTRLGLGFGDTMVAAARGILPKSEVPSAIMASVNDYIDAYKSYVSAFQNVWKNDITTLHHQENLNYINSLREDLRRQLDKFKNGTPAQKLKAIIPITQSSTDIVRRVMNAADGASLAVFRQVFTRQGARRILGSGPNRLTTSQIGLVFQEAQAAGKQAAEEAFARKGYSEAEAQQIGFDKMNDFIYEFVSTNFSATDASQLRDYAAKETAYELGIKPPEGGSEKVPAGDVFAHVAAMIQSASNYMSRESPLLGRMLLGFVSIPTNLANRSLHYTPYGLARYFAKAAELKKGNDELYLNSMGSDLQRRQRLVEGVAGTTAMLILGMLAFAGAGEDDDNYTGLRVTGSGPKDPALRDAWLKTGQKPNSFSWMVNGKVVASVPFGRGGFESIKLAAVGVAALDDMRLNNELSNGTVLDHAGDWVKSSLVAGLESTSYFGLKSISNAVSLGDSRASEASVASQAAWTTSGMVPWSGLIKSVSRPFVGQLDVSSAEAAITAQMPVLNALYGQKARNFLGDVKGSEPVDLFTKASDRLYLSGLPIYLALDPASTNGKAYELFISKGNAPSVPSRSRLTSEFGGVTDSQWSRYLSARGNFIKKQVYSRYNELRALNRDAFGDALAAISTAATREAKLAVFGKR